MSRYEVMLRNKIEGASDNLGELYIQLRVAAYRARRGDISVANRIISEVRAEYLLNYSAPLFAHLNFAEGICKFVTDGAAAAVLKLQRAQVLAAGCVASDELPALISAWLANSSKILGDWDAFRIHALTVLGSALPNSDETLARLCTILGDCFQEIEDYVAASKWYTSARLHALQSGDDAALSAVLHNRAAIHLFNLRISEARGFEVDLKEYRVKLEAESAENYSGYVRDSSMPWVYDLLFGQIHLMQGAYGDALPLLDSPHAKSLDNRWPSVDLVRAADLLRCKSAMNVLSATDIIDISKQIENRFLPSAGWGDIAIAANSVSLASRGVDEQMRIRYSIISREAILKYELYRASLREMLVEISNDSVAFVDNIIGKTGADK